MSEDSGRSDPQYFREIATITRAINRRRWMIVEDWLNDANIDIDSKRVILKSKCLSESTFFGAYGNPFHWACLFEAPSHILVAMLDLGGVEMLEDKDTSFKANGLLWAVANRISLEVIKKIVELEGSILASTNKDGDNSLHLSCKYNADLEVVKFIIEEGGSDILTARNEEGQIPLHYACRFHTDQNVAKEMLYGSHGQKILLEVKDSNGLSCLAHAFDGDGDKDLIKFLFDEFENHDGDDLLHKNTISMLIWTNNQPKEVKEEFLRKPFIRRVLNSYFSHPLFLGTLMSDFYIQVYLVWVFSFCISPKIVQGAENLDHTIYIILNVSIGWKVLREMFQALTTPFNIYSAEGKRLLDITLLFLVLRSTIILRKPHKLTQLEGIWICITTGFVWIHLIMVLGRLRQEVAVFVRAVKEIIYQLVPFYLITMLVVFSFGNMFYIATLVENRDCHHKDDSEGILEGWTCTTAESYFTTFTMLLSSDWIYFNEPTLSLSTVLAMTFATIIGILLLNILIAEIGVVWGSSTTLGRIAFWAIRLSFIVEVSLSFNGICGLDTRRMVTPTKCDSKNLKSENSVRHTSRISFHTLRALDYKDMESNFDISAEERHFFIWYRRFLDVKKPPFLTRMKVFFTRAPLQEILIPSRAFEKALSTNPQISRALIIALYPIMPISIALTFIIGLFSWGFLWPSWMKENLFHGTINEPIDVGKNVEDTKESVKDLEEKMKNLQYQLDLMVDLLQEGQSTRVPEDRIPKMIDPLEMRKRQLKMRDSHRERQNSI